MVVRLRYLRRCKICRSMCVFVLIFWGGVSSEGGRFGCMHAAR